MQYCKVFQDFDFVLYGILKSRVTSVCYAISGTLHSDPDLQANNKRCPYLVTVAENNGLLIYQVCCIDLYSEELLSNFDRKIHKSFFVFFLSSSIQIL